MSTSTLLTGISHLVTNSAEYGAAPLGIIDDAALVAQDGTIAWVGALSDAPAADSAVDLQGRAVLPGWVDSHSHLVFAGERSAEFSARMAGRPYQAGGIMTTVRATREATDEDLSGTLARHLNEMYRAGTTCVETKTGYGLTVADEQRGARLAATAGVDEITFLGAHLTPSEYGADPAGYLDLVCGPMLAAVAGTARFVDVFCEDGAFDADASRRVLAAGAAAGLTPKVHGNQLGPGPGVQLAVEMGAASVDHCTYLTEQDIAALAGSDTVATLLPACDLSTRQPAAPGRALLDAGATVALASNCNPGSSYTSSMSLVVALAVLQCRLTASEAVHAATAGGAKALRRTDVGHLSPGARADVHVLDAPSHDFVAYRVGMPMTYAVWRHGQRVV